MALHASVYPSIALKRPNVVYERTWYGMRFGINSIPGMWLVDKKGIVRDFLPVREELEGKGEKLLAEKD